MTCDWCSQRGPPWRVAGRTTLGRDGIDFPPLFTPPSYLRMIPEYMIIKTRHVSRVRTYYWPAGCNTGGLPAAKLSADLRLA